MGLCISLYEVVYNMPKISFSNNVIPINQIDAQQRKKIQKLYENAAKDVQRQIDNLKSMDKSNASTKLQIYRLNQLKDNIQYNLKEVTGEVEKEIKNNMKLVSEMTIDKYMKYMGGQGIQFKVSYAHISNDIINNIISGNLYKDQFGADWNFSKRIWGDYRSAKGELASIVTNGMLQGKGCYDIAKDLEKYVMPNAQKPWDWSKVYPGCRKKIDYNAQRLARTMISHSYQQSLVEMSKNNPFASGIEWRSALIEHRTCELCMQRHGQIFQVNELPLDHPNGLCTYLMVFSKSKKEIADDLVNWVNGEENEALDKYATYITNEDFSKMSKMQKMQNMKVSKEIENKLNSKELKITNPDVKLYETGEAADNAFRNKIQEIWNTLSDDEKYVLYDYTKDSDPINQALRGFNGGWKKSNFIGIENTKNNNKDKIDILTSVVNKSSYDIDIALRRDVNVKGLSSLLNVDFEWMYNANNEELKKELLGKEVTEHGFMSCSSAKNKGLINVNTLPSSFATEMEILCPSGTKMLYCEPFSAQGGALVGTHNYFDEINSKYGVIDVWNGKNKQEWTAKEQEMLIQRETSFVVTDISRDEYNKIHIKLEVIGQKY